MSEPEIAVRLDQLEEHLGDRIDHVHNDVRELRPRLETVESQARELHHVVMGDPERLLPSGETDRGLRGDVHDHGEVVDVMRAAIRIARWVAYTFGAAALALIGNLVANAVG